LDGTYDLFVLRGYEEDAFGVRQDPGLPPVGGVFESEGEYEAYARSVVDIGMEEGGELGEALGGGLVFCDRSGRHAVGLSGQDSTCSVIVN
jgi:hypothetical protein